MALGSDRSCFWRHFLWSSSNQYRLSAWGWFSKWFSVQDSVVHARGMHAGLIEKSRYNSHTRVFLMLSESRATSQYSDALIHVVLSIIQKTTVLVQCCLVKLTLKFPMEQLLNRVPKFGRLGIWDQLLNFIFCSQGKPSFAVFIDLYLF